MYVPEAKPALGVRQLREAMVELRRERHRVLGLSLIHI